MLDMLDLEQVSNEIVYELYNAKRPLLVLGWGVKLSNARDEARELAKYLDLPIVVTWATRDLFPESIGAFGTHGVRHANFAVQKSDYILCVGCRLDTKATGSPASSFAPKAKLVMVDVDESELGKMGEIGRGLYRSVRADARDFLRIAAHAAWNKIYQYQHDAGGCDPGLDEDSWYESPWKSQIREWSEKYPVVLPEYRSDPLNPYVIVDKLSDYVKAEETIVSDTGCVLGWMMQAYRFKGERFIHAFNNTPMGYGLPAAIGAAFGSGERVVLVTGDGGLSVNITEMATVARHKLPIKIILFNNRGHAMCRQTQRQWLEGEYPSTSYEGGLACPSYSAIAGAYGLRVSLNLEDLMLGNSPSFLELNIDPEHGLAPQAKFGHRLEDQEPLLPRKELEEIMA